MTKISKSDLESIIKLNEKNQTIPKALKMIYFKTKKEFLTLNPDEIDKDLIKSLSKIDDIFFSKWSNPVKLPAYFALFLMLLGLVLQAFTFILLFFYFNDVFDPTITFFIIFIVTFVGTAIFHVPAHYLIGLLVGIKTKKVFIATSSIGKGNLIFRFISKVMIVPGLKYDLETFLKASKSKRAVFLSAGVWLTYPIMFFNLILTLVYYDDILPEFITYFVIIFIIGLSFFVFITSWVYYGDLYKVRQIYKKREKLDIIS